MYNFIKKKWMAFRDIFKDENDINEKSVVGFASFVVMTIFALVDLVTGYFGKDLVLNEMIYNSFVVALVAKVVVKAVLVSSVVPLDVSKVVSNTEVVLTFVAVLKVVV